MSREVGEEGGREPVVVVDKREVTTARDVDGEVAGTGDSGLGAVDAAYVALGLVAADVVVDALLVILLRSVEDDDHLEVVGRERLCEECVEGLPEVVFGTVCGNDDGDEHRLLKEMAIVGLEVAGADDVVGLGVVVLDGADEELFEALTEGRGVGEERVVVEPGADVTERRCVEGEHEFGVGGALEADAAHLVVEGGRVAHQYGVGTQEEGLVERRGDETVDEVDIVGNVFGPRRLVAEDEVDVVVGEETVEGFVAEGLAEEVLVALARGVEDDVGVGGDAEGQRVEGAVGGVVEWRHAAVAHDLDMEEAGAAEGFGHVVVEDDERGTWRQALHGFELGGAVG